MEKDRGEHTGRIARYRNGKLAANLGWATTVLMCVAGAYGVWFTIAGG